MKAAIATVAVILLIVSELASADPIITVHKDKASVFTEATVPLIDGGTLIHSVSYEGSLLNSSLSAGYYLQMHEDRPGGESVSLSARSHVSLDQGSYGAFLELETQSELNYPGYPIGQSSIVFDDNREILSTAQASVEWVFSASEETLIDLYLLHKSSEGTAGARLYDKTAKKTIFAFDVNHWTDFEHFPGGSGSPWSYIESYEALLQAGHKYSLRAHSSSRTLGDDEENGFGMYFKDSASVQSVPEPNTLVLGILSFFLVTTLRARRFRLQERGARL